MLLAPRLEASGDLAGALKQYDAVLQIDPHNAPAAAQAGRILYLSAVQLVQQKHPDEAAQLVTESKTRLEQAIADDPNYADAYYYHAIVLSNEYGDFKDAQNDLQHYIVLAPNGQWSAQAHQLLADVTNALESPTLPNGSPSTTAPAKKSK
jgi:tetratricopeptide (TPR) repeat protein